MNWLGMNAESGRAISETAHILQSVRDILTTPIGTRVMRRDYGSEIFSLIDQPQHGATRLRLMAATVHRAHPLGAAHPHHQSRDWRA